MKKIIKKISEDLNLSKSEAELVISTLLERPRFEVYTKDDLDEVDAFLLRAKAYLLKKGVPLEYITKKVQFLNRSLQVHPGVFIPRLETEYFVELVRNRTNFDPRRILDMGTGCGAIAIGLADFFPTAEVFAVEKSRKAVINAAMNIGQSGLSSRIHLLCADFFESIGSVFDLIVSNPPYIPSGRIKYLPDSVKNFEPRAAIDGGAGGISFIKRLLENGRKYMTPSSAMAIEIDEDEVEALHDYLERGSLPFSFQKDLFGRYRYLLAGNFDHAGTAKQGHVKAVK